jgi:hypothetical protein
MATRKGLTCKNMVEFLNGGSDDYLYFDDESDSFGSDVSDRDSESDSNNVVSAVTYYFSSLKEETKSKRIEMDTHPLTQ